MRKILRRLMPIPIRERLEIHLERQRLAKVPSLPGDASSLRAVPRQDLLEVLDSEELAAERHEVSEKLSAFNLPDRTRGLNPGDRRLIYQLVRTLGPKSVLEVGTHIGASTAHIALAQRRAHPQADDLSLTTVDIVDVNDPVTKPWLDAAASHSPGQLLTALGAGDRVRFVAQNSLDFLANDQTETYDFVFLDGDHRAATVYEEICRVLALLRPGGVILLHDYYHGLTRLVRGDDLIAGPCLAVERLMSESDLQVLPVLELPWPTTLGSRATSMAILSGAAQTTP